MYSSSNLHSQRLEYQRENIDLSWKIVRDHSLAYNTETPDFNLNNIRYVDFGGKHGGKSIPSKGRIDLDIRHSFGPKITIHELLHVVAGKHEFITGVQDKSGGIRKFQGINEGLTEIIGLEIFLRNYKTIQRFREKYKDILGKKIIEAKQTGDELSFSQYSGGCLKTGWYHGGTYETLMHLNYVMIDYLSFIGVRYGRHNFEEIRKQIWEDICYCYFHSDIQGFSKLIAPIQRRTSQSLSGIGFGEIHKTDELIEGIKRDIADTFGVPYSLESFSEELQEFDSIFHSTF